MKIWIDIKNSHEPLFFKSLLSDLQQHDIIFTARDYIEVTKLLDKYGYNYIKVGRHHGKKLIMKLLGLVQREFELFRRTGKFDVSLSHGSAHAVHVAAAKRRKSIHIYDNDLPTLSSRMALPFLNYLIIPESIDQQKFRRLSKKVKIFSFQGFKEDIYIADFRPDPRFLEELPFRDFVAVRPEALKAEYVPKDARSIVPELLRELDGAGFNILYLPRYPEDESLAESVRNIHIPPEPLNGLDVCSYARAVLTGSGTFAREAIAMGTPAVSFYPGKVLLSVDRDLIARGGMIHSREPSEIVQFVKNAEKKPFNRERSLGVKNQVTGIIQGILEEIEARWKKR
jgi:predicted glycosyltransferase